MRGDVRGVLGVVEWLACIFLGGVFSLDVLRVYAIVRWYFGNRIVQIILC